jgi:hypothetical protein
MTYLNNKADDTSSFLRKNCYSGLNKNRVLMAMPPQAGMETMSSNEKCSGREGDANLVRWVNDLGHKRPWKSGLTYTDTKLPQFLERLRRSCLSYLLDQVVLFHLFIPLDGSLLSPFFQTDSRPRAMTLLAPSAQGVRLGILGIG